MLNEWKVVVCIVAAVRLAAYARAVVYTGGAALIPVLVGAGIGADCKCRWSRYRKCVETAKVFLRY